VNGFEAKTHWPRNSERQRGPRPRNLRARGV
jgi:hypothetical protein